MTRNINDLGEIARGGNARILRSEIDGRLCARKVLFNLSPIDLRRFGREILAQQVLSSPRIVPILDFDLEVAEPWYSMPIYPYNLHDEARTISRDLGHACLVMFDVLTALRLAHEHERRIIHRDVKPANVLLDNHGRAALGDFGLCRHVESGSTRLTEAGMGAGTAWFSSPEQLSLGLDAATERSDIFSAGRLLEFLIFGSPTHGWNPEAESLLRIDALRQQCVQARPEARPDAVAALLAHFVDASVHALLMEVARAATRPPQGDSLPTAAASALRSLFLIRGPSVALEGLHAANSHTVELFAETHAELLSGCLRATWGSADPAHIDPLSTARIPFEEFAKRLYYNSRYAWVRMAVTVAAILRAQHGTLWRRQPPTEFLHGLQRSTSWGAVRESLLAALDDPRLSVEREELFKIGLMQSVRHALTSDDSGGLSRLLQGPP